MPILCQRDVVFQPIRSRNLFVTALVMHNQFDNHPLSYNFRFEKGVHAALRESHSVFVDHRSNLAQSLESRTLLANRVYVVYER